jgi:hypothetical protein
MFFFGIQAIFWLNITILLFNIFQSTLIIDIRALVTWLKSTLLLKIACRETNIYM